MVFRIISQVQNLIIRTTLLELHFVISEVYIYMHLIIITCKSKIRGKILTEKQQTKLIDD